MSTMRRQIVEPRLLSVAAAANYLGVSEKSIRRYIMAGELKTMRLPSPDQPGEYLDKVLIERSQLDGLAERGMAI